MDYLILGFFTGLSLILATGAQNIFVIEQGLKKQYVFLVCLVCSISDLITSQSLALCANASWEGVGNDGISLLSNITAMYITCTIKTSLVLRAESYSSFIPMVSLTALYTDCMNFAEHCAMGPSVKRLLSIARI